MSSEKAEAGDIGTALVRRLVDDVMNAGRLGAVADLYVPDMVATRSGG